MPKTYNDLYLATRTALKNAGVEAYALEARLLVAYAVGKTKEEFVRDLRLYTSDENEQKIEALLQRRIAGEPLAYLIGEWEFHGLPIVVTPDVLIPRMDTEVLVDAALRVLVGRKMNARILDLCSGSGCIGCALAHELPAARVVMVDISDEALTVSKENLRRNHQNRTICLKADPAERPGLRAGLRGRNAGFPMAHSLPHSPVRLPGTAPAGHGGFHPENARLPPQPSGPEPPPGGGNLYVERPAGPSENSPGRSDCP